MKCKYCKKEFHYCSSCDFDEYNHENWSGETSAVHEVLGEDIVIHSVPFTRQPTAYIVK